MTNRDTRTPGAPALLPAHLEHFRRRVLYDALLEATLTYWRDRAETFEAAAPRAGDYTGQATETDLDDQALRCIAVAIACRNHATLLAETGLDTEAQTVIDDILGHPAVA